MKLFHEDTVTISQEHAQKLENAFDRIQRLIESIGDRAYNLETIANLQNQSVGTLNEDLKAVNDQIKAIGQVMIGNVYPGFENLDKRVKNLEEGLKTAGETLTVIAEVLKLR